MSIIFYALDVLPFFELYSSIIAMGNRIGFPSKFIPNILLVDNLHKLYKLAYVRSGSHLSEKLQADQDFVYSKGSNRVDLRYMCTFKKGAVGRPRTKRMSSWLKGK